jgi:TolB-like protein
MDALATDEIFLFEGFLLDRRAGGLFRANESGIPVPMAIGSRAVDLLYLLVKRHGDLVSKHEIIKSVWPGVTVADSNLPTQIWALRRVLDRERMQGSCIQTVAGRGYRFVAEVTRSAAELRPASPWISSAVANRQPIVAPRLSLVVLPFDNFSDRPDQHHFADRITDDLTTDLSRFNGMNVISRSTAFTYRNKPVGAKQIGRELGVRYVLEGGVHPSANHVRVNARLIDAETDTDLWAERFDYDSDDQVGIQDKITKQAEVALYAELIGTEASRPTEHPDALQYILQGRVLRCKLLSRVDQARSISLFERALVLNPDCSEAQGWLADALAQGALDEMAEAVAADIARAAELAAQAVAASPRSSFAHLAKGTVLHAQGRYNEAIIEFEATSAINHSWPHLYGRLSDCKFWGGSIEDSIPLAEQALDISPRDGKRASWYFSIGRVHLVQSRIREAIAWLENARSADQELPAIHAWLASAYALNGEIERAAAELAWARGMSCDGRYSSLARLKVVGHFGVPKVQALVENTLFFGLSQAGVPEE